MGIRVRRRDRLIAFRAIKRVAAVWVRATGPLIAT